MHEKIDKYEVFTNYCTYCMFLQVILEGVGIHVLCTVVILRSVYLCIRKMCLNINKSREIYSTYCLAQRFHVE
jgi:hypothetical protein